MGKIIGLIPARGGSKAIPYKSIVDCAGKPLLAYTAEAAFGSQLLDDVIVSTDDERIANVARQLKLHVPFLRPVRIANDATPMIDVIQHAYNFLIQEYAEIDALVLLQPTSPLRISSDIDSAVKIYLNNKDCTIVSVIEVPHQFNPDSLMKSVEDHLEPYNRDKVDLLRRQDKPKLYARNGPAILILPREKILAGELYSGLVKSYVMPISRSLDIDTPEDLVFAELLLKGKVYESALE